MEQYSEILMETKKDSNSDLYLMKYLGLMMVIEKD